MSGDEYFGRRIWSRRFADRNRLVQLLPAVRLRI